MTQFFLQFYLKMYFYIFRPSIPTLKGLLSVPYVGLNQSQEKGTEEILGNRALGLLRRAELSL